MTQTLDLTNMIAGLLDDKRTVGPGEIVILGGEFAWGAESSMAETLRAFLEGWDHDGMPIRIWEYSHRIEFVRRNPQSSAMPEHENYRLLERGRLFGEQGDLDFRRDGACCLWRFVGESDLRSPSLCSDARFGARDFWNPDHNPELETRQVRFHVNEQTALLWGVAASDGVEGAACWRDDRVGWADLAYPLEDTPSGARAQLRFRSYAEAGAVAFVWWTNLEKVNHV